MDPVLGASSNFWDRIEVEGTYFFNYDEVVDLQEEYTIDRSVVERGPLVLNAGWYGEPNRQQEFLELYGNVIDGIYFGDIELQDLALEIVANSPHIASITKMLLTKIIEMLAFEYSDNTLLRSLKLLNSLVTNPVTQTGNYDEELDHIGHIFEGLLIGTSSEIGYGQEAATAASYPVKMELQAVDDTLCGTFQTETLQHVQENLMEMKTEPDYPNYSQIKKECEDFLMMMDSNVMSIKKEEGQVEQGNAQLLSGIDELPIYSSTGQMQVEQPEIADDVSIRISEVSSEPDVTEKLDNPQTKLLTLNCDLRFMEELCKTFGLCSSHWGRVEQQLTYLLSKRLEVFFTNRNCFTLIDMEFIYRIMSGLWSLGDYAFREILPYLEKLDPLICPDYLINIFNRGAIYLKGRNDIFFYEWLSELCGDSLLPFMIFYPHQIQKYSIKLKNRLRLLIKDESIFKISAKVLVTTIEKPEAKPDRAYSNQVNDVFENFHLITKPAAKKSRFNFRFAGCRPVSLKSRKSKFVPTLVAEPVIVQQSLDNFNSRIVIGRRKLLKPVTNVVKRNFCANYHLLVL